jgi:hypothetical protein
MTIINFSISVELTDEETLEESQINQTLSDLEDLLLRHPAGYDLYDSDWTYED